MSCKRCTPPLLRTRELLSSPKIEVTNMAKRSIEEQKERLKMRTEQLNLKLKIQEAKDKLANVNKLLRRK